MVPTCSLALALNAFNVIILCISGQYYSMPNPDLNTNSQISNMLVLLLLMFSLLCQSTQRKVWYLFEFSLFKTHVFKSSHSMTAFKMLGFNLW